MSLDPYHTKLAKRLAVLVAEQGDPAIAQVQPTLQKLIGSEPLATRRAFCKAFIRYLDREIRAREVRIEHAGPVTPSEVDALVARFTAETGHQVTPRLVENPDLIGGLRVTVGDNVYDASVAGSLNRLALSVN
ncbi:MAG: F0F1 ATP synthase subunit delta [Verrucomicrobiota bacterium JB022]|nr:F0F1 ATP synthase subunit delta [Verrucomicrobiota bacterium JB022]